MTLGIERAQIPAAAGLRVHWFAWWRPKTQALAQCGWLEGLTVARTVRHGGRLLQPPLAQASLLGTFLSLQPCVVHMHYALCDWTQALILSRLHPLVVTAMGGDIEPRQGCQGEMAGPTQYVLRHADAVTSKTSHMDARLEEMGVDQRRIVRITWGADLGLFQPGLDVRDLRRSLDVRDQEPVFFCARSSIVNSNKTTVLHAFERARRHLRGGVLLVSEHGAEPAYNRRLRALSHELGISEHVRFVGDVPTVAMALYFNLADAVVSVPTTDGMPQTLYQAMACGTFPIVSDVPAAADLIGQGCALSVVPAGAIDPLAGAMKWVGENAATARRLGSANRTIVADVADRRVQDRRLLELYSKLLSGGRRCSL